MLQKQREKIHENWRCAVGSPTEIRLFGNIVLTADVSNGTPANFSFTQNSNDLLSLNIFLVERYIQSGLTPPGALHKFLAQG